MTARAALLLTAALALAGCNTVQGLSADLYELSNHTKAAMQSRVPTGYEPPPSPVPHPYTGTSAAAQTFEY